MFSRAPWRPNRACDAVNSADGAIVASVFDGKPELDDVDWPTVQANTALIAAAPHLLQMVGELSDMIRTVMIEDREPTESPLALLRRAYTLVGKAKGG